MQPTESSSNFDFLAQDHPLLERLGRLAERYFCDDPNTCLIKLRQLGEALTQEIAARMGMLSPVKEDQFTLLNRLAERDILTPEIREILHGIRKAGNVAAHLHRDEHQEALHHLKMATKLAVWFYRVFHNQRRYIAKPFIPPRPPQQQEDALREELERLQQALDATRTQAELAQQAAEEESRRRLSAEERAQQEAEERAIWEGLAQELEAKQAQELEAKQAQALQQPSERLHELTKRAYTFAQEIELTEAETRRLIDQQLADAGWEVDSQSLTFQKGTRPEKGRALAISEWPTQHGRADYVLFLDEQAIGIVEAKRQSKDVSASIEQAKRYSRDFLTHNAAQLHPHAPWDKYKIPFLFATNGRPFLQQLRTQSGIWFLDARHPTHHSRPLLGWLTPDGLRQRSEQDPHAAHQRLQQESTDYLGLREYQIRAIHAVEAALARDQRNCLLAMATGTGKTKTCVGLAYRLIKAKRFQRILFLVDRTALGEQAATAFKETRLESLQTFADIFEIKELHDILPDITTKLHLATVQGMVKRIFSPAKPDDIPPIDQYDCIIVDESHRGYNLDREMSDTEIDFRDQKHYVSTYRRVLDHFDAVKVALTATPALHTTEIFGHPIFQYTYREAVIDGWLVDHEPPTQIMTALAEDGITWQAGEDVQRYLLETQQIDLVTLEDELSFDIDAFNKKVITEPFNRAVCQELAKHIDPHSPQKTLIFCATDAHADLVVLLLKEALQDQYGEIEEDAVLKITGKSDKPNQLIRRFRNERFPNLVTTVDLLTTGIDIPAICNLVFLRRVKSRILYEQMLGRATRLCPAIGKETFHIFDAVRLYEALEPFSTMKPVVTRPKIPFSQLAQELYTLQDEAALASVKDEFLAKLQRKAHTLSPERQQELQDATQLALPDLLQRAHALTPHEIGAWLQQQPSLTAFLDRTDTRNPQTLFISQQDDHVRRVESGYGTGSNRPDDYLESFAQFIQDNQNRIPALLTVLQRPRELTRAQLKELLLALHTAGYTDKQLQSAWRQLTNEDIAASIIGFIRQQALREPLLPYPQRVEAAYQKILQSQPWTKPQRDWLTKIKNQLIANLILDREALDSGIFQSQGGGFKRLNEKIFDGQLDHILEQLKEYLWSQAS